MAEIEASTDKVGPRRWNEDEDTLLVDLLLSLHKDGKWKAEGGFKSGYLVHLEKLFLEKMPDRADEDVTKDTTENGQQYEQSGEVSIEGSGTKKRSQEESSKQPSKKKLKKNKEIQNVQKSFERMMGTMLEESNAQVAQLTAMLEEPKNYKVGLREELGRVNGIPRASLLSLCMKMTEGDVAVFRDLTDEDEKYDFLGMVLERN